jgi:maltose/moltooligosaccharide transporter
LGFLLRTFMGGEPIYVLAVGGASWILAGLAVLWVREPMQGHLKQPSLEH